jgi:hypothetical protein
MIPRMRPASMSSRSAGMTTSRISVSAA